ncbi:PREDICTED: polygalacturonase At1g48100 [Tarenaya hassleriana]|uniref:polygalacturonase At1g48100 n=1 Tax=Tarenaya hassleriana TaxID=28532 RepID=UPI00053C9A69|nr:PREDICTED: polygalacturonase At1g48100 [Tarenaya hassleriana]
MKKTKRSSLLALILTVMVVAAAVSAISVEARKHNAKKSKPHHRRQKTARRSSGNTPTGDSPAPSPYPAHEGIFDILSFGAKADGVSDDSMALVEAWKAACEEEVGTEARVKIPAGKKFMVKPVTLQGPCKQKLVVQIDGTVVAPDKIGTWPKSSLFQWLNFKWLDQITVQGSGTLDARGSAWWDTTQDVYQTQKRHKYIPPMKPTALRFYASSNVTVRDIRIVNSPLCHLKFDNSEGVNVDNITISSPENSPNTDGIHLQNTRHVHIQHSNIACGDDCVSIQTGSSDVHIHHINCGPGHGISLGGLGKDKSVACVSDIIVEDISIQNTLAGVRIKTWQGGLGMVKNVTFSKIQVSDVKVPIVIDQYYCDKYKCKNQTGAVAISGVRYDNIVGSFTVQPVHIACSSDVPCMDVDLVDIRLKPSQASRGFQQQALCWNSYGKTQGPLVPSAIDDCLRNSGGGFPRRIARSHEHICH